MEKFDPERIKISIAVTNSPQWRAAVRNLEDFFGARYSACRGHSRYSKNPRGPGVNRVFSDDEVYAETRDPGKFFGPPSGDPIGQHWTYTHEELTAAIAELLGLGRYDIRDGNPTQELKARRRRRSELHPDNLGREQTPAERAEYTRLMAR